MDSGFEDDVDGDDEEDSVDAKDGEDTISPNDAHRKMQHEYNDGCYPKDSVDVIDETDSDCIGEPLWSVLSGQEESGERAALPSILLLKDKEENNTKGRQRSRDVSEKAALQNKQRLPSGAVRTRHGARNQARHKIFVKWLLEKFPRLTLSISEEFHEKRHVLDVAGGKGEVAARLTYCHQVSVVMVDPRPANVPHCFEMDVLPKLPKKWQERFRQRQQGGDEGDEVTRRVFDQRFRQLVMEFREETVERSFDLQEAIAQSSLLIGLHADSATEAIVDAALQHNKPFVVIPCCVFPRFFPQRFLVHPHSQEKRPVRTHEEFCQYLLQKDARFQREEIPFQGRNVAIWWDGGERYDSRRHV